jgi:hypothetical protein
MDKTTTTMSYTASGATAAGGLLSLNDWALVIGIIVAIATFGLNWWYQARKDSRERELYEAQMAQIQDDTK